MSDSFTFEKKKRLMGRIQNLKDRTEIMDIKNIIFLHNDEPPHMKNSNGMFFVFDNLSEVTYIELVKYLDKKDKKNLKKMEKEIKQTSELLSDELGAMSEKKPDKNVPKSLKLTNAETHLLNRRKYEEQLQTNEDEAIENGKKNDNDVFIKQKPVPKRKK